MEAYKTTCPDCGHVRFWTGYKTGIGKSDAQLEQMHKDHTVCAQCGSPKAQTTFDAESPVGQVFQEQTHTFVEALALALGGKPPKQ